jgi:hypothetical protein
MRATTNDLAVFVQARLNSSRFPRKILAQLAGRPVLEWVLGALGKTPAAVKLVLTDAVTAPEIRLLAARAGFGVFVGSPDDVFPGSPTRPGVSLPGPGGSFGPAETVLSSEPISSRSPRGRPGCGLDLAAPVDIPPGMGSR